MKYISFIQNHELKFGLLKQNIVYDATVCEELPYRTLLDFVRFSTDEQQAMLKNASDQLPQIMLDQVQVVAPFPRPLHDILCVGVNYYDHFVETVQNIDATVANANGIVYFSKRCVAAIGTGGAITAHRVLDEHLDYEVELAVVIGKTGKNIEKEDVSSYIFGYSVANDVSARQLQKIHGQWWKGKSLDGFTCMGPIVVTPDEIEDPHKLSIALSVNGKLCQSSNTSQMMHSVEAIICDISRGITLEAGDVIFTGTPAKVDACRQNKCAFLQPKDKVQCEIEGIGSLENIIIDKE